MAEGIVAFLGNLLSRKRLIALGPVLGFAGLEAITPPQLLRVVRDPPVLIKEHHAGDIKRTDQMDRNTFRRLLALFVYLFVSFFVDVASMKAADLRVAEVVRSAGEQREQAERELADAALAVGELDQALARERDEREALEHTLNDFRQGRQEMAIEIATLTERLLAAEKQASAAAANHATELQQMSERCTQLERALIDEKHRAGAELESLHSRITELSVKAAKDE